MPLVLNLTNTVSDIIENNIKRIENLFNKDYYFETISSVLRNKQQREEINKEILKDVNSFYKMLKSKFLSVGKSQKEVFVNINDVLININLVDEYILSIQLIWDKIAEFLKELGKNKKHIHNNEIQKIISLLWIKNEKIWKKYEKIIKQLYNTYDKDIFLITEETIKDTFFDDLFKKYQIDNKSTDNLIAVDWNKIKTLLEKYSKWKKTLKDLWIQRKYIVKFIRKSNKKINYSDYWDITIFKDGYRGYLSETIEELIHKEFKVKYVASDNSTAKENSLEYFFNNLFTTILDNLYVLYPNWDEYEKKQYPYVIKLYVNHLTQLKIMKLINSKILNNKETLKNRLLKYKEAFLKCYYWNSIIKKVNLKNEKTKINKERVLDIVKEGRAIKIRNIGIINFTEYMRGLIENYDFDNNAKEIIEILGRTLINKQIKFVNSDISLNFIVKNDSWVKTILELKKDKREEIPIVFSLIYTFNYIADEWTLLTITIPQWTTIRIGEFVYKLPSNFTKEIYLWNINIKRCKELNLDWLLLSIIHLENIKDIFDIFENIIENDIGSFVLNKIDISLNLDKKQFENFL